VEPNLIVKATTSLKIFGVTAVASRRLNSIGKFGRLHGSLLPRPLNTSFTLAPAMCFGRHRNSRASQLYTGARDPSLRFDYHVSERWRLQLLVARRWIRRCLSPGRGCLRVARPVVLFL
jgi:hypothetical protein